MTTEADRIHAEIVKSLRAMRIEAGMSQQELAGLVGITQAHVSRLERGVYMRSYSLGTLNKIANALGYKLTVELTPKEDT